LGANPPERMKRLVRLLTGYAKEEAGPGASTNLEIPGNVLFDVEVDGVRCLLIAAQRPQAPRMSALSPREKEVAVMVAEGYPNKTIAAMLRISSWTVSTYLRRIFVKLDVHSRTAMVSRLFEAGVISETADVRPTAPWWGSKERSSDGTGPPAGPRLLAAHVRPARMRGRYS
jgi:DNA-binding CsgD family transcriptional regulator